MQNTVDDPYMFDDFPREETKFNVNAPKDFVNEKGCIITYVNSECQERCGSPGETENDFKKGNQYFFQSVFGYRTSSEYIDLGQVSDPGGSVQTTGKYRVWTNIALFKNDQIRQRVAWALAQIFVVSTVNLIREEETEFFLKY